MSSRRMDKRRTKLAVGLALFLVLSSLSYGATSTEQITTILNPEKYPSLREMDKFVLNSTI